MCIKRHYYRFFVERRNYTKQCLYTEIYVTLSSIQHSALKQPTFAEHPHYSEDATRQ